jgi:hypothetical protein
VQDRDIQKIGLTVWLVVQKNGEWVLTDDREPEQDMIGERLKDRTARVGNRRAAPPTPSAKPECARRVNPPLQPPTTGRPLAYTVVKTKAEAPGIPGSERISLRHTRIGAE